jgi:hypothetical protein
MCLIFQYNIHFISNKSETVKMYTDTQSTISSNLVIWLEENRTSQTRVTMQQVYDFHWQYHNSKTVK